MLGWRRTSTGDGPWCPTKGFGSVPLKILQRLAEFDTRRWGEVEGTESHQIDVTSIGAEAQKRLDSMGHLKARQIETLFSMRFGARERLWGVREGDTLHILWWDPEHEVYPTKPKNT